MLAAEWDEVEGIHDICHQLADGGGGHEEPQALADALGSIGVHWQSSRPQLTAGSDAPQA